VERVGMWRRRELREETREAHPKRFLWDKRDSSWKCPRKVIGGDWVYENSYRGGLGELVGGA